MCRKNAAVLPRRVKSLTLFEVEREKKADESFYYVSQGILARNLIRPLPPASRVEGNMEVCDHNGDVYEARLRAEYEVVKNGPDEEGHETERTLNILKIEVLENGLWADVPDNDEFAGRAEDAVRKHLIAEGVVL